MLKKQNANTYATNKLQLYKLEALNSFTIFIINI